MALHPEVQRDIAKLFGPIAPGRPDRTEAAYAVFGLGLAAANAADQVTALDASEPLTSRLEKLEADLRYGLHLCAEQLDEFDPSDPYVSELQGQGFATLIALRELYRHFPDVFG